MEIKKLQLKLEEEIDAKNDKRAYQAAEDKLQRKKNTNHC